MRELPQPDRLCVDCRLALRPGETCGCVGSHIIAADRVLYRGQLEALGGRRPRTSITRRTPKSHAGFTAIEVFAGGPLVALAAIITVMAPAVGGGLLALLLFGFGVRYAEMRESRARGSRALRSGQDAIAELGDGEALTGTVQGRGVAGSAFVVTNPDGAVVLRSGATDGFRIALDDGRSVVIGPGSIVILDRQVDGVRADDAYQELLTAFPNRRTGADDPFVDGHAHGWRAHGGDRVTIACRLTISPDPNAADPLYRDAASSVLRPDAVPILHIGGTIPALGESAGMLVGV